MYEAMIFLRGIVLSCFPVFVKAFGECQVYLLTFLSGIISIFYFFSYFGLLELKACLFRTSFADNWRVLSVWKYNEKPQRKGLMDLYEKLKEDVDSCILTIGKVKKKN